MGTNNKRRRAAKARSKTKAQERARRSEQANGGGRNGLGAPPAHGGRVGENGSGGGGGPGGAFGDAYRADPEGWTHDLLVEAAAFQFQDKRNDTYDPDLRTATLFLLEQVPVNVLASAGERALMSVLGALWAGGWQPAEVQRQARLKGGRAVTARLMSQVLANDDARRRATALDSRWIAQVEAMDLPAADGKPGWGRRWIRAERLEPVETSDVLIDALEIMCLPTLERLIPPPGSKGAARPSASLRDAESSKRDPLRGRIRALLAKAESTDFEEEAMAFTAKAQELITRHAIDAALLSDGDTPSDTEPSIIRVPLDPPYWDAKGLMLQVVAEHTRCRAVMMPGLNMSRVAGYPADLVAVEMLFTSLLIQAQTALTQAGKTAPPGTRTRSTSYRSSFLVAYADRIGDRLAAINAAVATEVIEHKGDSFLPVLRAQEDRIDDVMTERFGETISGRVRGGYDPAATAHGRIAADSARLSSGDVEGDGYPNPGGAAAPRAALPAT